MSVDNSSDYCDNNKHNQNTKKPYKERKDLLVLLSDAFSSPLCKKKERIMLLNSINTQCSLLDLFKEATKQQPELHLYYKQNIDDLKINENMEGEKEKNIIIIILLFVFLFFFFFNLSHVI